MSRFENQMSRSDLYRIARAFVDAFIASYKKPPRAIILDIDDTQDTVYGTQQLAYSMAISMLTPTSPCIFMRGNRVS